MGQDTRKDPRAKVLSLNVRYKSATVDEFIEHHSHDISKGGIFIKTPSPFPAGTLLKFEIRIREDQPLIAGVGRVVWKREPPQAGAERPAGMGVKFIKLDGHSRELIDRIVAERKDDGPSFEETADGNAPSMRPAASVSAPPVNTVSGGSGGNFFPSGPPAEQPPAAERTVIKQADEILADALKGAGLGDVSAPPPIELPKSPAATGGAPPRKQTLLGMPSVPGAGFKLPDDVAAAAKEYENKIKSEPKQPIASEPPTKSAIASEPPTAKEPATRSLDDRKPASDPPKKAVSSVPPPIPKSDRPAAAASASKSESRRPPPLAQAAAPATEQKSGGAAGWLVVLLLVAAAGAGGYYLMTKGNDAPTPPPTTAPSTPPSPATSPSASSTETAAPTVSTPPPPPVESVSAAPSPSPAASPSTAPSPSPAAATSSAAPPVTAKPPPPPPPPVTAKPPPPPPPPVTAKPPPPPPPPVTAKPPPKPKPTDDNPYQ